MDNREKAIATMGALKAVFLLLFAAVFISSRRWLNFELNHCTNLPARYSLEKCLAGISEFEKMFVVVGWFLIVAALAIYVSSWIVTYKKKR